MGKRKLRDAARCMLLLVEARSESNSTPQHAELHWTPSAAERLLLETRTKDALLNPAYDRGAHANDALCDYFAERYALRWRQGDPTDTSKEDSESDDEVAEFIAARRRRTLAQYTWVLSCGALNHDARLARDRLERYLQHVVRVAHDCALLDACTRDALADLTVQQLWPATQKPNLAAPRGTAGAVL